MTGTPAARQSVLVVDDTPENLAILKAALKDKYTIYPVPSGPLALRVAAANRPDLVLLDIMMPEMDGYEVLERLRADPATRDIPVIFITALSEVADELKGLQLGAVDYITKPFVVPVVQARVDTHMALRAARARIEQQNRLLTQERDLIEEIISSLRQSESFDAHHLRYLMSSVDKTNGDVLLSAFLPDGRQWVLVGDIAGHGPAAAMSIPAISHVFYRRARDGGAVEEALTELNAIMNSRLPANIFMPYCLVEMSADRQRVRVWNGGLPGCVLVTPGKGDRAFESNSYPLGIGFDIDVAACLQEAGVAADARLYLFTDGLSELPDGEGRQLGDDGVMALIADLGADTDLAELWPQLEAYHGNRDFPDDITLVEVSGKRPAMGQ